MRVLMTTDTVGGVWTYCLQLAAAVARHGVSVDLATMGRAPSEAQLHAAAQERNVQLHVSEFRLEWMPDPWRDVDRAGDWLLDLERQTRPDVVHLNGYSHGVLPFAAPAIVVGHSCVLSWWRAVRREEAPHSWDEYRRRVAAGLRAAKHLLAPSQAMLDSLRHDYGPLPPANVRYNARPAGVFRPAEKLQMIMSVGRLWDEAKNLLTLDRAAPRIPWPVYVAGEARHPAGGITPAPNVSYLGTLTQRQIAARLGASMMYVLPARYEPFGLSILEAALAGCVLVIGDIPSLREIWREDALYVDPNDAEALAGVVRRLIQDPARMAHSAARSQRRAREFTVERFGRAYHDLYTALCSSAANSVPTRGS